MAKAGRRAGLQEDPLWMGSVEEARIAAGPEAGQRILLLLNPAESQVEEAVSLASEDGFSLWPIVVVGGNPERDGTVVVPEEEFCEASLAQAFRFAARLYQVRRENHRARGDVQALSYLVGHDLRSPMTSILTLAYLLHEGAGDEPAKLKEYTQSIIDSTDELGVLIDRLCFLGRFKPEGLASGEVDMGRAFQAGWIRACQQAGREPAIQSPQTWPEAAGDAAALEKIWEHLLSNALVHAGASARIRAGWEQREGRTIYWVEDDGPGVERERVPNLLRPFHRLHFPGSPKKLGLPIAQRLVELLGGRLSYQALDTGGARFEFTLGGPAARALVVPGAGQGGGDAMPPRGTEVQDGRISDLEQLHEATLRVARATGETRALHEVLKAVLAAVGADKGLVALAEADGKTLKMAATQGFSPGIEEKIAEKAIQKNKLGEVLRKRGRVVFKDIAAEVPPGSEFSELSKEGGFRAVHSVPLLARSGAGLGILTVIYNQSREIGEREFYLMDLYAQMASDFIQRSHSDRTLRVSEERLRRATETGKVGVWDWDIADNRIHWTASLYQLHGIRPEEFDGTVKGFSNLVHPEDRPKVARAVKEALEEDRPYELEFRAVRPDGSLIWLFANAVVIREQGKAVRMLGATLDVTPRKKAEEELSRSEGRFHAMAQDAPVAIFMKDVEGRYIMANALASRAIGRAEGVVGKTDAELLPPALAESLRRNDRQILNEKRTLEFVEQVGGRYYLSVKFPLLDHAGQVQGICGIAFDVTERNVNPSVSRFYEERLQIALDAAGMGDWSWEVATDMVTLSGRASQVMGIPPGPHMAWKDMQWMILDQDRDRVMEAFRKSLETGSDYSQEYRIRRPDGAECWVLAKGRPWHSEEGRLVGMRGVLLEITRQKADELAARRLAAIVESSADAIVSKNLNSVVTSWNKGAERLFGYTAEEMIGKSITLLIPSDHSDEEPAIMDKIRRGERIEHYETIRRRKDGRLIEVSLTVSPVRDNSGRIVGVSKIARDISLQNLQRRELEAREIALRKQTHSLSVINSIGTAVVGELELEKLVQMVTDAAREISGAAFGAFFYNTADEQGETYTLYTLSGAPREAFDKFGMPRKTPMFAPTFEGEGVVRVGDVLKDPRYGNNPPHQGMPEGHLPVRSYMAIPVISRNGHVLGGIFLGHPEPDRFTEEAETILRAIAGQASVAIDNAHLYTRLQQELEQQRKTEEALRSSEQQLRLTADNALVFIIHCGRDHRFKFVNRPYARRYGLEPEEIIGKHVAEITGEEAYLSFRQYMDRALEGERVEFEMELPYSTLGSRWVHVIYEPERSPDGEVLGLVGVINDITQRKQQERDLEWARDQALAASKAKDDFLAALSHELRTPLNPILLLASESAENTALPSDVRECFLIIRNNVELEARLIDDLLDLSRIITGKLGLEKRNVGVHEVLNLALDTVQGDLAAKNIRLSTRLMAQNHHAWADPVRLQQVFWNILKNAVKFTPEQGNIEVATQNVEEGKALLIKVSDSGVGMNLEDLTKIFELFSQADQAGHRFGGLGLGLAIARKLMDGHEGHIWAESEGPGMGSTFYVQLPVLAQPGPAARAQKRDALRQTGRLLLPKGPEAVSKKGAQPRAAKILLVEDHEPTRTALAQLFRRRRFSVDLAGSLHEAREYASKGRYDLLVSDIGLPDGSGHELMREIAQVSPGIKGIALTGYGMEQDIALSGESGFSAHLTKPVHVQALDAVLEAVIGRRGR